MQQPYTDFLTRFGDFCPRFYDWDLQMFACWQPQEAYSLMSLLYAGALACPSQILFFKKKIILKSFFIAIPYCLKPDLASTAHRPPQSQLKVLLSSKWLLSKGANLAAISSLYLSNYLQPCITPPPPPRPAQPHVPSELKWRSGASWAKRTHCNDGWCLFQ